MAKNYFTAEQSWKRLYFITGKTADEFYPDSISKLNIEQLTWQELKNSGYERIVFFDPDNKLYCYDDMSYALLRKDSKEDAQSSSEEDTNQTVSRTCGGLRRGRNACRVSEKSAIQKSENPKNLQRKSGDGPLHLGMRDSTFVKRQLDAYMYNASIKTAIVINDPTSFLQEFGEDPLHSLTAGYERLGSENQNIIVFIYTDADMANIYEVRQASAEKKDANIINIPCPNALELKNMLMYMKINYNLKFPLSELTELAVALHQALQLSEQPVRIKELYTRLRGFGTEKTLDKDNCYEVFGKKKPEPAKEQLTRLIGMDSVKKTLSEYETAEKSPLSAVPYLTASRLQPDFKNPVEKKEMMHAVITGPPGTGKTTVAELLGQLFFEMGYLESGHVVKADRSKLVGSHIGETAILVRQKVEEALGGVLFIDEAYSLKREESSGNDFGQEAIDTLCKLMDEYKGRVVVVAAGYQDEMDTFIKANDGLASRFTMKLNIEPYTSSEMVEILKLHAQKSKFRFSGELEKQLPDFCENWVDTADPESWGNAREAENLINHMDRAYSKDPQKETICENNVTYGILEVRHIPKELQKNLQPVSEVREKVLQNLNAMIGLEYVKRMVEIIRRRMLTGKLKEPGHYVYLGNPGTGKTTVARYMGQILRNLGMLKRGQIVEYTATDLMAEVFNKENQGDFSKIARKALDGILFIDEAYQLAQDHTGRGQAILAALLPYMENNHERLCVIVAGYEEEMREFMKDNPGYKARFTETIRFDNYTGKELTEILLQMLEEKGITADEEYRENALRALTRYIRVHGKERDFGNARYIRNTFLPASLDAQIDRLIGAFGEEFPQELGNVLTGEDIPADMVRYARTPLKKEDTRTAMEEITQLIGCKEIKTRLKDLLELQQMATKEGREELLDDLNLHMVLRGNPGVGKTTIAKLIGKAYKEAGILPRGHVVKVTRADLVAGYVGHTEKKTKKAIESAMGGVLFIDEAYTLKRSEDTGNDYGQVAIDLILEQMSDRNGEFAVIVAGYPDEMEVFLNSNPGFRSRYENDYLLPDYTAEELLQIFTEKCESKKFYLEDDMREAVRTIFENMIAAKLPNFANGREAENLEKRMRMNWVKNPVNKVDEATGEKRSYYTREHIPQQYHIYLKENVDAENLEHVTMENKDENRLHISVDKCAAV